MALQQEVLCALCQYHLCAGELGACSDTVSLKLSSHTCTQVAGASVCVCPFVCVFVHCGPAFDSLLCIPGKPAWEWRGPGLFHSCVAASDDCFLEASLSLWNAAEKKRQVFYFILDSNSFRENLLLLPETKKEKASCIDTGNL